MKEYFKKYWNDIKKDAIDKFPNESCGLITDGKYISLENVAECPTECFQIKDEVYLYYSNIGQIEAIVHSHNDFKHVSLRDMEGQIRTAIPWGMVNVKNKNVQNIVFWGDQLEPQDLIGRPFIHGVYDCYALCRDYYKEKSIVLENTPREYEWWIRGDNILDNFKHYGFEQIDQNKVQDGDVVLFQVAGHTTNHCGIYLGDGSLLHHLPNRLSRREPANLWVHKYATYFLRYSG